MTEPEVVLEVSSPVVLVDEAVGGVDVVDEAVGGIPVSRDCIPKYRDLTKSPKRAVPHIAKLNLS